MSPFRFFLRLFTRKKHRKSYKEALRTMPGLVAYYQLDEVEGTVAHDSSGNGHHATLKVNVAGDSDE